MFLPIIIYHTLLPLLIISGVHVIDSAVCGIYITMHIVIDVQHWNSTFQLTASVFIGTYNYTHAFLCKTAQCHSIVEMTNLWCVGSPLLVLCMVSIALLIVAADTVTARLAGSN